MAQSEPDHTDRRPHRDDDSLTSDGHRRCDHDYQPNPGADADPLNADDVAGPIFEGVVNTASTLEIAARHVAGVIDRAALTVTDDGLTLSGITDSNVAMVDAHLGRKDFTVQYDAAQPGTIEVPTDDLVDAVRFLDGNTTLVGIKADPDGENIAVRVDDGDRFAGLDVPTGEATTNALLNEHSLPDVPLAVSATAVSATPITSFLADHTRSVIANHEAPVRDYMDLSRHERRARENGGRNPCVLVTASAPETMLRSEATTDGGDYARESAVVTLETPVDDVDPVVLGAADEATADLEAFNYAPPALEDGDDRLEQPSWMPLFESETVAAAHAGNEVLAQTGVDVQYLKDLLGGPTKGQMDVRHELAFGWHAPVRVMRSFFGGGFVRGYVAPRMTIP